MTKFYGVAQTALNSEVQTTRPTQGHFGGKNTVFVRDVFDGDAAQNDTISLGVLPSTAILDPVASVVAFDDMGTSITLSVGDATHATALVNAADVATAAGQISALKSVDIINWGYPLWKMLGYAADPGGNIELLATLGGGDPASGTIAWQLAGQQAGS